MYMFGLCNSLMKFKGCLVFSMGSVIYIYIYISGRAFMALLLYGRTVVCLMVDRISGQTVLLLSPVLVSQVVFKITSRGLRSPIRRFPLAWF